MATMQVNGKAQNSTPRHAKSLNRSAPKLGCVITSWILPVMLNVIALPSVVYAPHIRDFAHHLDD